ncbi:MAG: CcmD family protein [Polyangiaceae bacterium]|nr:CcmD family protein [Polyangiaceae bacterium]
MQTPSANPNLNKTPEGRAQEFQAVQGAPETTSAEALLITAYIGMWAILMVFVFLSWRRQQKLNVRIAELEAALAKRKGA